MTDWKHLSEDEWKKRLSPEQYHILREKGTEPAFTSTLYQNHDKGKYVCAACGYELFSSDAKFDSGTGWPSFDQPMNREHVDLEEDNSYGMHRIEVNCKNCGSHLGHVFNDGPKETTGERYCINGCSLSFKPN